MARFRRPPYLSCFYCGQRTSTRNDGRVRQFECQRCDATNYLDENGEITDPPISTTAAAPSTAPLFVSNPDPFPDSVLGGGLSPGSDGGGSTGSASSTVFCKTCLKNQHLFIASLAQYFPADPNHPDSPELERRYFRFRQGLEQRYPQVCANCEPKVLERIRAAGYTAKTDHLRRMVDYSRRVRVTQRTYLDSAQRLGRCLWWTALLLQLLWQAGALWADYAAASGPGDTGDTGAGGFSDDAVVDVDSDWGGALLAGSSDVVVPAALQPALHLLAARAGQLQSLCIGATLAACWWNPYFVQTVHGFTKTLIGIPTWYAYQATIVVVRLALARVAGLSSSSVGAASKGLAPTVVGAHAFALLFALYLHTRAPRSIRKDLRPLFGKLPTAPLTPQRSPTGRSAADEADQREAYCRRRSAGLEILSDVLDEISASPARDALSSVGSPHRRKESDATDGWDGWQPSQSMRFSSPATPTRAVGGGQKQSNGRDLAYGYNDDNYVNGSQYGVDEMDWTPTQPGGGLQQETQFFQQQSPSPSTRTSPYRAFRAYGPGHLGFSPPSSSSQARAFDETPVTDDRGSFWYKVPPAPTSMAQRILNRPNAPRLVQRQTDSDSVQGGFRSRHDEAGAGLFLQRCTSSSTDTGAAGLASSVEFAQPSFFAEDIQRKRAVDGGVGGDDDPGSFLSDLFSQTFTLGSGGDAGAGGGANDDSVDVPSGQRRRGGTSDNLPHRRRVAGSLSLGRHVAQLALLVASSSVVYVLQTRPPSEGSDGDQTDNDISALGLMGWTGLLSDILDRLSVRSVEMMAVGVCLLVAAVLARESTRRWSRAVAVRQAGIERQRQRSSAAAQTAPVPLLPAALGVLLGLASLAQAGWMAYGLYEYTMATAAPSTPSSPSMETAASYDSDYDGPYGGARMAGQPVHGPWSAWQVAWLHGTVVAHQVWNLVTG